MIDVTGTTGYITTQTTSTVTVCIRSRSIKTTDDDIYEKNKKKKPNEKDDWSDKALENFLETLREQPVKEMNDRRNKWIMCSKTFRKERHQKNE